MGVVIFRRTPDSVVINFFDVEVGGSGFTYQYAVPTSARRNSTSNEDDGDKPEIIH